MGLTAVRVAGPLDAVPDDRWSSPSPREGWSARDLVGHVVSTQAMFLGFINEEMPASPNAEGEPADAAITARMLGLVGRTA